MVKEKICIKPNRFRSTKDRKQNIIVTGVILQCGYWYIVMKEKGGIKSQSTQFLLLGLKLCFTVRLQLVDQRNISLERWFKKSHIPIPDFVSTKFLRPILLQKNLLFRRPTAVKMNRFFKLRTQFLNQPQKRTVSRAFVSFEKTVDCLNLVYDVIGRMDLSLRLIALVFSIRS